MEMSIHYVAFIDILGFKSIVEKERESGYKGEFLNRLYRCHKACGDIFNGSGMKLIQFSDSIVISQSYTRDGFVDFASAVSQYQLFLLDEGILCRGGIAVNKHYSESGFIFSPALIDAYKVESEKAVYPRIVLSEDLADLIFADHNYPSIICKENDGMIFVNYLYGVKRGDIENSLGSIIQTCLKNKNSSVMQKGIWLANYSDKMLGTNFSPSRFEANFI